MDRLLPVLIPAWVIIVLALWALVSIAETVINIWLAYLNNRLEHARATTTASTGCAACAIWESNGAAYCASCGLDLQNK